MPRTVALLRTHRLTPGILSEFAKLAACQDVDAFVLADGDKLFPAAGGEPELTSYPADGREIPVFPVAQRHFEALGLPCLSHEPQPTRPGVKWCNGDYPLYVFQRFFPEYDFYWMLDYDVFFNGRDYTPFFAHYAGWPQDFLAGSFGPAAPAWMWAQGTDWAYPPEEKRCAFFPAVRFSARALPALLERRRELGLLYAGIESPGRRWPGVELFVPTEVDRLGFSHARLDNLGVFHCQESLDLGEDRLFEHPDNRLYHPVKGDFVSRVRRGERRIRELEIQVRALRAENAALKTSLSRSH